MSEEISNTGAANIVWHKGEVTRADREKMLKQKGAVLWLTGLSGSGKSTVANTIEKKLLAAGKLTYLLDGDNIRHGLNQDLGFSIKDRTENIRRIAEVSRLFVDAGIITLTAFISPLRADRNKVRQLLGDRFIEIFVDCSLNVCENRDPKGLYKKARAGEIKNFTGIDSPYEKPQNPEIMLYTDFQSVETCADSVLQYLRENGLIQH